MKKVRIALYLLSVGIFLYSMPNLFNLIEDKANPVVIDFIVDYKKLEDKDLVISGSFKKERNCDFLYLIVYGSLDGFPKTLLDYEFLDNPNDMVISRVPGEQYYGPWSIKLINGIQSIEIYSRHNCGDSEITTKLTNIEL